MNENFDHLGNEEKLKAENNFLKMKMMLETGAEFSGNPMGEKLNPQIENEFLNYIMEFEKQSVEQKMIKVFDRIGRPSHFKAVSDISDAAIEEEWQKLYLYMKEYGVELSVCSPNIGYRELYRFATEELFEQTMNDMNIPGMMSCFTYDEFYPDHIYDNTNAAIEDCIKEILRIEPLEWMHHFKEESLQLNHHQLLSQNELKKIVTRFKESYDDIISVELNEVSCEIIENICYVKGDFSCSAILANEKIPLSGNWLVCFEQDEAFDYWYIFNVQINGIHF